MTETVLITLLTEDPCDIKFACCELTHQELKLLVNFAWSNPQQRNKAVMMGTGTILLNFFEYHKDGDLKYEVGFIEDTIVEHDTVHELLAHNVFMFASD